MKAINIHSAKSNLSRYIKMVALGEEVIICSAGSPVAKLIPYLHRDKPRKPGIWKGKIKISNDFDKMPASFMKYFNK